MFEFEFFLPEFFISSLSVLRRRTPKVRRNPPALTVSFVGFFAAVKKMAPTSRGAIGPEVPDECLFSVPSSRGAMVQKILMNAYSLVSLCNPKSQCRVCHE